MTKSLNLAKHFCLVIFTSFFITNKAIAQALPTLELDYLALVPPLGPNTNPITIPFSLDTLNNNTYSAANNPISLTVSLRNQAYTGLTYSNASTGLTFGGGATLSSGGTVQQSASNVPFDLLGTYPSNAGPKSYMFTAHPNAVGAELGTGFDVDGDLFSNNNNGAVQLFTTAQVLFDNNTPKNDRKYFGEVVFNFSRPVVNPVMHFAGMGGSYSFLPFGLPSVDTNYQIAYFSTELELANAGLTSTLMSGNAFMSLSGNNILNSNSKPNGGSFEIPGELPLPSYGAATGSVRLNGTVQEVVYKVFLKGSDSSDIAWSAYGLSPVNGAPLTTGATRNPFTGDIWWATASLRDPTQQISGSVFYDIDSLLDNNIATNSTSNPNHKVNPNMSLKANLLDGSNNVVAVTGVSSDGVYVFDSVAAGTYTVQLNTIPGSIGSAAPAVVMPTGWIATGERNGLILGSDGLVNSLSAPVTVVANGIVTNVNFGIRQPLSIGNLVWEDLNGNGIKEIAEPGLNNAVVKLYQDANSDGIADGASIATYTTSTNGLYVFENLFDGKYLVGVTPPTPALGNNFKSSSINELNPNTNIDNNDNGINTITGITYSGTIILAATTEPQGETPNNATSLDSNSNLTIDFGFFQPINISGTVFEDNNGPANVDGVGKGNPSSVSLYANLVNTSGNTVANTLVNVNGTYSFADVVSNATYSVVLSTTQGVIGNSAPTALLPNGWVNVSEDCCDNIGNDGTGNGLIQIVTNTSDLINANFGIRRPLFIGNYVWTDLNSNGIRDESPSLGLNGVTVKLYSPGINGIIGGGDDILIDTKVTANLNGQPGYYKFDSISSGAYYVCFPITNASASLTTQNATANTDLNSDANVITGFTPIFNLIGNDTTIDAGYLCVPPTANAGSSITLNCITGSATIGTPGIAGNTYSWLPTTGLNSATLAQPITTASSSTIYTLTVSSPIGCTAQSVVTVTVNTLAPIANAGADKLLNCNIPSATIGSSPIAGNTYNWSPSAALSASNIAQPITTALTNTSYVLTVTNTANGCTSTDTVEVQVNKTAPIANAGPSVTLTCSVTSSIIGTTALAGHSYVWSPATNLTSNSIAQPIANPSVSTIYTVTVTNTANGCTAQSTVAVNVNTTLPTINAGPDVTVTCTTPTAVLGTTSIVGYTYNWSPTPLLNNSNIAQPTTSAIATTVYTVTVTNTANGCTSTDAVLVTVDKTSPIANPGPTVQLNCNVTSSTIGTTSIMGNTYSWAPNLNLTSTSIAQPTASPVSSTIYTLTVTNSTNGCSAQSTLAVNVNTTPPPANAGNDIILNCTTPSSAIGTGAVPGNTYSWSPSTALSATNIAQPITNAIATTVYTVTVTNNANGCISTDEVIVNVDKTLPTANAGGNVNLTCINTNAIIGTTAIGANTYSWSPSTSLTNNSIAQPIANPITTTIYTVTVTNPNNGCISTSTATVNVNTAAPLANAGTPTTLTCISPSKVLGIASVIGNTYSWSPATDLSSATVAQPTTSALSTTVYTLTVTNSSNGCTATNAVLITVNKTLPIANAGTSSILTCLNTSTQIGTPAVPGNIYSWTTTTNLTSATAAQPTANPSVSTVYTLTVTNTSNGCTSESTVLVDVDIAAPTANASFDVTLTCTNPSVTLGTSAIAANTYSWSPSTALSAANIAQPVTTATSTTNYTVTVTNSVNGCTATDAVLITVNKTLPVANAGVDVSLTCLTPSATIGTAAIVGNTYAWLPNKSIVTVTLAQPTVSPNTTTNYTVTVTNPVNGCTATDVVVVNVNKVPPVANAGSTVNLNCNTTAASIGTLGVIGNTYFWTPITSSPTSAQPLANPLVNTTYTLTVTNTANGCTAQSTVLVTVDLVEPIISITGGTIVCNGSVTPLLADGGITYLWNTGASVAGISAVAGSYTVTGTGANGCTSTADIIVENIEGSAGNYAWIDSNADGLFNEAASAGINGLDVELWDVATNSIYATAITQDDLSGNPGYFNFIVCNTGDYFIKFPTTYGPNVLTTQTSTPGVDSNSDADANGNSPIFNIEVVGIGQLKNNTTIDVGYFEVGGISNYVWFDLNKNGIQDNIIDPNGSYVGAELPVPNVTINLYKASDNSLVATSTSDISGLYSFVNLIPDSYYVKVDTSTLPATSEISPVNIGLDDAIDNDFSPSTNNSETIYLYSGISNSNYDLGISFNDIPSITDPCACNEQVVYLVGDQPLANNYIYNERIDIHATPGGVWRIIDSIPNTGIITKGVRLDPDNDGFPQLVNATGSIFVEDSLGEYHFNFAHREPDGYVIVASNGKDTLHISNACHSVKEPVELKIDSICAFGSPITLQTTFSNGTAEYYKILDQEFSFVANFDESVLIANGTPITTINPLDYPLNSYIALYVKWTPNAVIDSTIPDTTSCPKTLFMNIKMSPNFDSCGLGTIGNFVWNDLNADGVQGIGEPGFNNVVVTLYNNTGESVATTTTDAYGKYSFAYLVPGTYSLGYTLPANYVFTASSGTSETDGTNSDVNPITGKITNIILDGLEIQNALDAGIYYKKSNTAKIGNRVWFDANSNGIQDASEVGVSNVVVSLIDNLGGIVGTSVTDLLGNYKFTDVNAGAYTIKFNAPMGSIFTPNLGSITATANSDANILTGSTVLFTVAPSDDINYIDAGINLQAATKTSVGEKVWNDIDIDGIQDSNEPGVANVTVNLFAANGATQLASTITDALGNYSFNNLDSGTYVIGFVLPANYDFTDALAPGSNIQNNSDANVTTGKTASFSLKQGDRNASIDAGLFVTTVSGIYQLGDKVWYDTNKNGLQDPTEIGVPGVTVNLFLNGTDDLAGTADDLLVGQTTTDLDGKYLFANLDPSTSLSTNYNLQFKQIPEGYSFTNSVLGSSITDSDPLSATGRTESINLLADNLTIDAGIILGTPEGTVSIGDQVFFDLNNNGIKDAGEPGASDVVVKLYADLDNSGLIDGLESNATLVTTTDALGHYMFTGQNAGSYQIGFSEFPAGYTLSSKDAGSNDMLDSDGNPMNTTVDGNVGMLGTSYTNLLKVANGADKLSIDLGIVPPINTNTLGDFVWLDMNADGLQSANEPGVNGVMVTLYDVAGLAIDNTVTDENGKYKFVGLPDGTYNVGFGNLPAGFAFAAQSLTNTIDGSDAEPNLGITEPVLLNALNNSDESLDAGLVTNRSVLGGSVWMDDNKDGIQNISEMPVTGVTVNLFAPGIGIDGVAGNADDALPIATSITNSNGNYLFGNLNASAYQVGFSNMPAGYVFAKQLNIGDNQDNTNSDANPATGLSSLITLSSGEIDLSIDAGISPKPTSFVGDRVWLDANRNNLQEASEIGVPGVLVGLYNSSNVQIGTSITNGVGRYALNNVPAGVDYTAKFISNIPGFGTVGKPTWAVPNLGLNGAGTGSITESNIDSDPSKTLGATFGITGSFEVLDGSNLRNIDAGVANPITLSGNVWHDVNGNLDNLVNNSGQLAVPAASPIPVGLRVYLVNPVNNVILKVALVPSSTGIFIFNEIEPSTNYYLILSKNPAVVGSVVPIASLPIGWENTGEKLGITPGTDGVINGRLNILGSLNNIINANFAIRLKNGELVTP
jgi:hypothetical protein